MNRLLVRSVAEAEIEEAHLWYVLRSTGVATAFLDELEAAFERISENPEQFPEIREGLRRARLRNFPFGVYYTVVGDVISVVGVVHARRHPRRWSSR